MRRGFKSAVLSDERVPIAFTRDPERWLLLVRARANDTRHGMPACLTGSGPTLVSASPLNPKRDASWGTMFMFTSLKARRTGAAKEPEMLNNRIAVMSTIAFLGAVSLEFLVSPAGAGMPIPKEPSVQLQDNIQLARRWVYVPSKHGKRYAYRRNGYHYHYGGWWYARPWWTFPVYSYAPYGYGYGYPGPWWPGIYPGINLCIGC